MSKEIAVDPDPFWHRRRVLITGACGFLGAWIADLALAAGARIFILDSHLRMGCLLAHDIAESIEEIAVCDVRDAGTLGRHILNWQPEVIFHMAGQGHINAAQADAEGAFRANLIGTLNVVAAAAKLRETDTALLALVVASSNHVYGSNAEIRTEDDPLAQLDVYGASKGCLDLMARSLGRALHLPIVAVRNVNTYGPGDPHESHLITGCVKAALAGIPFVLRGDGTSRKHYLYAEDTARAYLLAAKYAQGALRCRAFNVAPPLDWPVRTTLDIARQVARVADLIIEPLITASDTSQSCYVERLDPTAFRTATGWWPKWNLEDGIRETLRWYREHGWEWARGY